MATIAQLTTLSHIALTLASHRIRTTPSKIVSEAENGQLVEYIEQVSEDSGVEAVGLESWSAAERASINEEFASWANAIDVERRYGTASDRDDQGWIALPFGITDQIRMAWSTTNPA